MSQKIWDMAPNSTLPAGSRVTTVRGLELRTVACAEVIEFWDKEGRLFHCKSRTARSGKVLGLVMRDAAVIVGTGDKDFTGWVRFVSHLQV